MSDRPSTRQWVIEAPSEEEIGAQLARVLVDVAAVLARIGGVVAIGSDREEIAPDIFRTVRVVVRWESFAPARRLPPEPEDAVEDAPPLSEEEWNGEPDEADLEPEPVAAE